MTEIAGMARGIAGWLGVLLLAASLAQRLVQRQRARSVAPRARLPLLGKLTAAGTLAAYALLQREAVFASATLLVLVAALAGEWIERRKRQRWCQTIPTRRSDVIPFHPRHVLLKRRGRARYS